MYTQKIFSLPIDGRRLLDRPPAWAMTPQHVLALPMARMAGPTIMNAQAHGRRRHVDEPQLHPFDAVPAVETQGAGGVHGSPAALPERDPEFLSGGAKRDGIDDRAIAGTQPHTHMGLPHLFGIDD